VPPGLVKVAATAVTHYEIAAAGLVNRAAGEVDDTVSARPMDIQLLKLITAVR